jgi:hypothetical protein
VASYQCLIVLSKIDSKPDESAYITTFSDPSVCKQRGHAPAAERNAILAPQGQEVSAACVGMTGIESEVVCEIVQGPHVVEEAV